MVYDFTTGYTFSAIQIFMEGTVAFDQLEYRANSKLSFFILLRFIITAKYINGVFWSIFVKMNEKKGKNRKSWSQ